MNFSKIWVDAGRKTNLVISNHLFRGNKIGHQKIIFAHGLREKYVILDYCKLYVMEIIKIETQWHLKAYPKSIGPTLALKTSYKCIFYLAKFSLLRIIWIPVKS